MHQPKKLVIAIDGYSSCGKSTLAQQLADCLSYIYIDSGAMYRAVTLYFLHENIDISDLTEVQSALDKINLKFIQETDGNTAILLNNENVSSEIRTLRISSFVSEVAAIPIIREFLVAQQQAMQKTGGIVMDGRDIGTVVFPDADIKIFVKAELQKRIDRRYNELLSKGLNVARNEVEENLKHRDLIDTTREVSPLIQAEDSILLDNTELNKSEQLRKSLGFIKEKFPSIAIKDCI